MRAGRRTAQELRQAIDCLPARTREAMLEGIGANEIIVGAYTDRDGRVCPMLAAHRSGGRTSLASFARAWDRYTCARRPRPATERELRTLRAMLEASLMYQDELTELAAAAAEHRALLGLEAAEARAPCRLARRAALQRAPRPRRAGRGCASSAATTTTTAALAQIESEEKACRPRLRAPRER